MGGGATDCADDGDDTGAGFDGAGGGQTIVADGDFGADMVAGCVVLTGGGASSGAEVIGPDEMRPEETGAELIGAEVMGAEATGGALGRDGDVARATGVRV